MRPELNLKIIETLKDLSDWEIPPPKKPINLKELSLKQKPVKSSAKEDYDEVFENLWDIGYSPNEGSPPEESSPIENLKGTLKAVSNITETVADGFSLADIPELFGNISKITEEVKNLSDREHTDLLSWTMGETSNYSTHEAHLTKEEVKDLNGNFQELVNTPIPPHYSYNTPIPYMYTWELPFMIGYNFPTVQVSVNGVMCPSETHLLTSNIVRVKWHSFTPIENDIITLSCIDGNGQIFSQCVTL